MFSILLRGDGALDPLKKDAASRTIGADYKAHGFFATNNNIGDTQHRPLRNSTSINYHAGDYKAHNSFATNTNIGDTQHRPLRNSTSANDQAGDTQLNPRKSPGAERRKIHVVTANNHFYGSGYERNVPDCKYEDQFLMDCIYTKRHNKDKPDVLLFHIPNAPSVVHRDFPHQLLAGISMEPGAYHTQQKNPKFMNQFDIRMYYNWQSEVPVLYANDFLSEDALSKNKLFQPTKVPSSEKLPKLVYINSNCATMNGRNNIVRKIMAIGDVKVDSFGGCLTNKSGGGRGTDKIEIMSKYKFCIAMENSNEDDYVSEKIWHALVAGCLPVYYGAPNIQNHLPVSVNKIIINYADFGTPEKLSAELRRLNEDDALYEEYFKWRELDPYSKDVLPGFRWLMEIADRGHTQCELCKYAAKILDSREKQ